MFNNMHSNFRALRQGYEHGKRILRERKTRQMKSKIAGKGLIQQIEEAPIPKPVTRKEAKRKMDSMGKQVSNRAKKDILDFIFPNKK